MNIPQPVQEASAQHKESCDGICGKPCLYHFSHTEIDEETGETYYVYTCGQSAESGFYHADGSPELEIVECAENHNVYQDDGQLIAQFG